MLESVYFKRGDQREEGAELHREYKQRFGGWPDGGSAPDFRGPIPGLGLTITVVDPGRREHRWWEDRLLARGWLGMELDEWIRACAWVEKHGSAERLRQLLTDPEPEA